MVGNCNKKFNLCMLLGIWVFCYGWNGASAKPLAPVSVSINPVATHTAGQPTQFEVRSTVSVDAQHLTIRVEPIPGMILNSGQLFWSGVLAKGETKTLTFSATLTESGPQILRAYATIHGPGGAQLSSSAVFRSGTAPLSAAAKSQPNNALRNGRRIEEHSLAP